MSKNGILKSNWFIMNEQDARVIDTNALVEDKLKEISQKLAAQTSEDSEFAEGFIQGIDAMQVADLVGEETIEEVQGSVPEDLIQQAKEEIEEMKAQAMKEIEQAKKKALEEGKKSGYQAGLEQGRTEGFEKGHEDGLAQAGKETEHILKDAAHRAAVLEQEYENKLKELEPQLMETLTDIYEHIFKVSLKNTRDLVVYLIENTMRNIEGSSGYLIHVSKEDYPFVSMQKKELVKGTGIDLDIVDIIEDATLGKSECMIETGNGVFDCSLGVQLEALNEELRLLSYEPDEGEVE